MSKTNFVTNLLPTNTETTPPGWHRCDEWTFCLDNAKAALYFYTLEQAVEYCESNDYEAITKTKRGYSVRLNPIPILGNGSNPNSVRKQMGIISWVKKVLYVEEHPRTGVNAITKPQAKKWNEANIKRREEESNRVDQSVFFSKMEECSRNIELIKIQIDAHTEIINDTIDKISQFLRH